MEKIKCIKDLYKSTYKGNAFDKGNEYKLINKRNRLTYVYTDDDINNDNKILHKREKVKFVIIEDNEGNYFDFTYGKKLPFYNYFDYFQ